MNPIVQKLGPPGLVLCAALYLGWPADRPMDLADNAVRAKTVRWKPDDLKPPVGIASQEKDPFQPVLVTAKPKPVSSRPDLVVVDSIEYPSESLVRSELMLAGIAQIGGRRWAVINGKTRVVGDEIDVDGQNVTVQSVAADHVVLGSGPLEIKLRPYRQPRARRAIAEMSQPSRSSSDKGSAHRQDQTWQADEDSDSSPTQNTNPTLDNGVDSRPGATRPGADAPDLPIKLPFNLPL
ncbi:hypothetical protein [Stieleria varia]|uniref:Uncharacterized protein n=1 Tax=Stieleria varia TaxID=2528005 RepID=A0A5C6B8A5_9BACT|nr:hypothetical protein [Stieleria varia]TWU08190.1 hypothetical protein Pla52n_07720 [Stieleria varia]